MTEEIRTLIGICHHHLRQVDRFLELGQPNKSAFHSSELGENARLLANAIYRVQRVSGAILAQED